MFTPDLQMKRVVMITRAVPADPDDDDEGVHETYLVDAVSPEDVRKAVEGNGWGPFLEDLPTEAFIGTTVAVCDGLDLVSTGVVHSLEAISAIRFSTPSIY